MQNITQYKQNQMLKLKKTFSVTKSKAGNLLWYIDLLKPLVSRSWPNFLVKCKNLLANLALYLSYSDLLSTNFALRV